MKKLLGLFVIATTALATACGLASTKQDVVETNMTDRAGREVYVPETIERAIVMAPSIVGTLTDLGVQDAIVGVDKNSHEQYEFLTDTVANLGSMSFKDFNIEKFIELDAQVVFTTDKITTDANKVIEENIKKAGISVISVPSAASLSDINLDVNFLGKVFRKEAAATKLVNEFNKELNSIKTLATSIKTRRRVYSETFYPGIWTTGGQTFQNDIIESVGAVNIFGYLNGHQKISEEIIIANGTNIEVILTTAGHGSSSESTVAKISARNGWDVINAVKNEEVYLIDSTPFNQSNVRSIAAIKQIAKLVYPEVYANI